MIRFESVGDLEHQRRGVTPKQHLGEGMQQRRLLDDDDILILSLERETQREMRGAA